MEITITAFQKLEEDALSSLIPCRKVAYESGAFFKLVKNGIFLDLLSLYNGQWHYITTHKLSR
jgi:hypothetical protein